MAVNIILELGCNHNGSMENAKRMIDDAVRLHVWGVKMQKRDIESIPNELAKSKRDLSNSFGATYYEHRKALEFSTEQMAELKQYAEERGLAFACSAFDPKSIRDLVSIGVVFIKLPSQFFANELMNMELDKYYGKGIVKWHSTGMHTTQEILDSMYLRFGFYVTFYCRSMYPFMSYNFDIGSMVRIYHELGPNAKGYSSHDFAGGCIRSAVILGATWIERHYTLDNKMKGSDHGMVSSDFVEMTDIIKSIENAQECLYMNKLDPIEQRVREMYMGKDQ